MYIYLKVTGKLHPNLLEEDDVVCPTLQSKLTLQHLDIETKYEKLLFIEQFTIDSKVSEKY